MTDPNLINLSDKIADLKRQKMSCDWGNVQSIQDKINHYQTKLSQGLIFEPAF